MLVKGCMLSNTFIRDGAILMTVQSLDREPHFCFTSSTQHQSGLDDVSLAFKALRGYLDQWDVCMQRQHLVFMHTYLEQTHRNLEVCSNYKFFCPLLLKSAFPCLILLDYFPKLSRNTSCVFVELVKKRWCAQCVMGSCCQHWTHHSRVHLIRPHSLCVRHTHSVSGCTIHLCTWTPAADLCRRAESDLQQLKHTHRQSGYRAERQWIRLLVKGRDVHSFRLKLPKFTP